MKIRTKISFCTKHSSYSKLEGGMLGGMIIWSGWPVWAEPKKECPFCGSGVHLAQVELDSFISPIERALENEKMQKRVQSLAAIEMIKRGYQGEVPLMALYEEADCGLSGGPSTGYINPVFYHKGNGRIDTVVDKGQKGRFIGRKGRWVKQFAQCLKEKGLFLGQIKERPRKLAFQMFDRRRIE